MDKNELYKLLIKTMKLNERRRNKRFVYTVLFYSAVMFGFFTLTDQINWSEFWDIAGVALVCIILSVPFVLFSSIIFYQLFEEGKKEEAALDFIRKQLEQKEREESRK